MLLLSLLVVALAVPAGVAHRPRFPRSGQCRERPDGAGPLAAAPRQPQPGRLRGDRGRSALRRPSLIPAPSPPGSTTTLKPDGAGTFSGVVQDAATGRLLFDRSGNEARVPASNMKLLTAAAALRVLGPDRRFSTRVVAGAAPGTVVLTGGGDVLLGAGESAPDAVLGHAGLATLAQATVRALQHDGAAGTVIGAAGRLPLHRPVPEPGLEPRGRGGRRDGPAVPAGPELGTLRSRPGHRPPPPGRCHERGRGVLRPARSGRRRGRTDGGSRRRTRSRRRQPRRPGEARPAAPASWRRSSPRRSASRWTCCCGPRTTTSPR